MEQCGILFNGREINDIDGCIKPEGHNDFHVCKTNDGKFFAWEDDGDCDCGCWDDYENGDPNVCKIYWEVKHDSLQNY